MLLYYNKMTHVVQTVNT